MNSVDQFFNQSGSLTSVPTFIDGEEGSGSSRPVIVPNAEYFEKFLARCYNSVLNDETVDLNQRGDRFGDPAFRKALSAFMFRFHKVEAPVDNIVVGPGMGALMFRLMQLHTLRHPSGEKKSGSLLTYAEQVRRSISPVVAIPEDVSTTTERLFKNAGFGVKKVAVDDLGVSLDSLLTSGTTILFVTPVEPPEFTLDDPAERRQGILDWASEADYRYIIENDDTMNISIDTTFKNADTQGKVIYMNSFSNLLCKGLSIAWMVLPDKLLAEYKEAFGEYDCQVPYLDQLVLTMFLDKGYMDNYLESVQGGDSDDF
ncbi:MAG: hypothetical protein ILP18_05630 [Treponema sp.]|nr:hypothetical protein [Treponema sp.]